MPITPARLIRPTALTLVGVTAVAIALGRAARPPARLAIRPARYTTFNSFLVSNKGLDLHLVDRDSGAVAPAPVPVGEALTQAACSPWRDARGDWQLAGYGWDLPAADTGRAARGFALVRLTTPGGRLLNRVETDDRPVAPPCWDPSGAARILFAGRDGQLYRLAFEGSRRGDATAGGCDPGPQRLAWRAARPVAARVEVTDPCWPTDPRLGRRLVVSLRALTGDEAARRYTPWRIWWVQLDRTESTIEAAEPLTDGVGPDRGAAGEDERFPCLWAGPGGGLLLAYLAGPRAPGAARLSVAPIRVESDTGHPSAAGAARVLAEGCLATAPAPSSDGVRVCVLRRGPRGLEVLRPFVHVAPPAPGDGDGRRGSEPTGR